MATGMEAVIELPLRKRTRGLLIETADRILGEVLAVRRALGGA